jgi:exodeoxyribonuclease VII small subunit
MSDTSAPSFNGISFEEAYTELERIVARLEAGDLPLEESVKLFERGRKLASYCQSVLDRAELRVNQIADDGSVSSLG